MERLQKVIAESGFASRRKAEELIKQGKVYVNGIKITILGTKVHGNDIITINGSEIKKEDKVYYLMNKPRGVISSVSDDKGRKTVVDLINTNKRIYPVGRLDYDTTGLIIITNDGELANILMHPKNKVEKKYIVKLNKALAITDLQKLKKGINIDGIKCTPTKLKLKKNDTDKDFSIVEISIIEGRNHIIKNLFLELGYLVDKLSRIEYGFLDLGTLKSGEYRLLNIKEVKKLYDYKN
ncbi:MAG: pseudouridine synthase [Bacilli bacterium]|nr:pseudouridine synthase [Bacilli bacterium]MDD3896211.1 pseudouridine synthase [Bacilli bacterium]MDD4407946.1 pseudouridine synthase [Bacilli bacterium]